MTTSSPKLRLTVLGSTGSIGVSTLDVIARHPDRFEVFALTGASRVDELAQQCLQWKPRFAAMPDAARAAALRERLRREGLRTEVLAGEQALDEHQRFVKALALDGGVDVVAFELVLEVAGAHAQRQPPARERIDHRVVLGHRGRKERRLLREIADGPAKLVGIELGQCCPVKPHLSPVRGNEPRHHAKKRRFACPGRAGEPAP